MITLVPAAFPVQVDRNATVTGNLTVGGYIDFDSNDVDIRSTGDTVRIATSHTSARSDCISVGATQCDSSSSIAIGFDSRVKASSRTNNSTVVGDSSGATTGGGATLGPMTIFGQGSTAGESATNPIIVGQGSTVNAANAAVIGNGITNTTANRIHIGSGSQEVYIPGKLTVSQGTLTTAAVGIDISATWNAGGATFFGIRCSITDTASNAFSNLIQLLAGGSNRFLVRKDGLTTITTSGNVDALTINHGTLTAGALAINTTATWNAAAAFTHWKANVTDTNSNAGSKLIQLQIGGSDRFAVTKEGRVSISQGTLLSAWQAILTSATWNAGGTTFDHILCNVTDTASSINSRLINLQIGSSSRFVVRKDGQTTIANGTLTTAAIALVTSATWNNAGVTFTHWQANVTDTASNAGSLLVDMRVGGSSKFKINKAGQVRIEPGTLTSGTNTLFVTETWDNAGVAFVTHQTTIVDTNSNAGSSFCRYSISGVGTPRFEVRKDGRLRIAQGAVSAGDYTLWTTTTWNNGGSTFIHWYANITDTASGANSKFLDLAVGGVSRFAVSKTGQTTITQGTLTAGATAISTSAAWNNAGVTFTHWKASVTNTASTAASRLLLLEVGGTATGLTVGVNGINLNQLAGSWGVDLSGGATTLVRGTDTVAEVTTASAANNLNVWASPQQGDMIAIRNKDGGGQALTIGGNGNNIDGAATLSVADGQSRTLIYNGTEWTVF
jgi:hypothetical protein